MSPEIYARTPGEVRRYRALKGAVAATLLAASVGSFAVRSVSTPPVSPLVVRPTVTKDDAMRADFPIRWGSGGQGNVRRRGKHSLFGQGPENAEVAIYDGEKIVMRARSDKKGRWKAQVTLTDSGIKAIHAEFRRGAVAAGKSRTLRATVLEETLRPATGVASGPAKAPASGEAKGSGAEGTGTEISITNLAPNDRVIAGFFTLRGNAPPGDFVQIYVDATLLGRAEVDLAGRWSFKPNINRGGRRTFTVVDEITERQFGPLPVFIAKG